MANTVVSDQPKNYKPQTINHKLFLSFQMNGKHDHPGLNAVQHPAVV